MINMSHLTFLRLQLSFQLVSMQSCPKDPIACVDAKPPGSTAGDQGAPGYAWLHISLSQITRRDLPQEELEYLGISWQRNHSQTVLQVESRPFLEDALNFLCEAERVAKITHTTQLLQRRSSLEERSATLGEQILSS